METCIICNKANQEQASYPGRYIYEDANWVVCHSPAEMRLLGTLCITSKLQYPFASRRYSEAATSFENIWRKAYIALTKNIQGEIEIIFKKDQICGCGHYVLWIVPLRTEQAKRGIRCFQADESCREDDVIALENKLRETMK